MRENQSRPRQGVQWQSKSWLTGSAGASGGVVKARGTVGLQGMLRLQDWQQARGRQRGAYKRRECDGEFSSAMRPNNNTIDKLVVFLSKLVHHRIDPARSSLAHRAKLCEVFVGLSRKGFCVSRFLTGFNAL
ncbi:hypothetical protein KSP40_PGU002132 [Platanthera guangdongensis]|uniref:Uncharacterized protein n=1 Tax=Platanthera guangdongensis TaxID=2320717 RepID=A0ABR2LUH2_9ASPA